MRLKIPFNISSGPAIHYPAEVRTLKDTSRALLAFLQSHNVNSSTLALTGAGISVESGIPDYRGPKGTYTIHKEYRPIFYQEFISSHESRQRYWARGFLGWNTMEEAKSRVGRAHIGLGNLADKNLISSVITQNVDMLHTHDIPSSKLLELHGTLAHAVCLTCGSKYSREILQKELIKLNSDWIPLLHLINKLSKIKKVGKDQFEYHEFLHTTKNEILPRNSNINHNHNHLNLNIEKDDPDIEEDMKKDLDIDLSNIRINPDGDIDLASIKPKPNSSSNNTKDHLLHLSYEKFKYPPCPNCLSKGLVEIGDKGEWAGAELLAIHPSRQPKRTAHNNPNSFEIKAGILKPAVTFFGEPILDDIRNKAQLWIDQCDKLLVLGTSLATYSSYGLVKQVVNSGRPVAIISMGNVRGDDEFIELLKLNETKLGSEERKEIPFRYLRSQFDVGDVVQETVKLLNS